MKPKIVKIVLSGVNMNGNGKKNRKMREIVFFKNLAVRKWTLDASKQQEIVK